MKKSLVTVAIAVLLAASVVFAGQAGRGGAATPAQGTCDRACLEGFVDQYLDAMAARDPKRLPLAANVKFTENGQRLPLGDGAWNVATGKGAYRLFVADVPAQQVAFIGTVKEEAGFHDLIALRLKLVNRQITEVEQIVIRPQNATLASTIGGGGGAAAPPRGAAPGGAPGAPAPAQRGAPAAPAAGPARGGAGGGRGGAPADTLEMMGKPHDLYTTVVPPAERMSRADLIKIANMYFSGMQQNDGKGVYPFADDCDRFENAGKTTNNGQPKPDPKTATGYSAAWSCKEQFESGLIHFVTRIRDRRYVAVDQERGLVFSFAFFDHMAGKTRTFQTPDGRTVTGGPNRPWTWEIAELFKIEKGLIRRIEAILVEPPYGMPSGWSTYEEGLSDQARDVTGVR